MSIKINNHPLGVVVNFKDYPFHGTNVSVGKSKVSCQGDYARQSHGSVRLENAFIFLLAKKFITGHANVKFQNEYKAITKVLAT